MIRDGAVRLGGLALALGCPIAAVAGGARTPQPVRAQDETTVTYHAGWNLVAAPTGTILEKAVGPAYTLVPGSDDYRALAGGELVGGRAVWVYFADDTTVTLGRSAAEYSRVVVSPETAVLAGNPTGSAVILMKAPCGGRHNRQGGRR